MVVKITMHVREVRKAKGLTIAKLSALSGVSMAHISEVETGKQQPTLYVMCLLAAAMGVALDELFTWEIKK